MSCDFVNNNKPSPARALASASSPTALANDQLKLPLWYDQLCYAERRNRSRVSTQGLHLMALHVSHILRVLTGLLWHSDWCVQYPIRRLSLPSNSAKWPTISLGGRGFNYNAVDGCSEETDNAWAWSSVAWNNDIKGVGANKHWAGISSRCWIKVACVGCGALQSKLLKLRLREQVRRGDWQRASYYLTVCSHSQRNVALDTVAATQCDNFKDHRLQETVMDLYDVLRLDVISLAQHWLRTLISFLKKIIR